jgi:hypothetical protein
MNHGSQRNLKGISKFAPKITVYKPRPLPSLSSSSFFHQQITSTVDKGQGIAQGVGLAGKVE